MALDRFQHEIDGSFGPRHARNVRRQDDLRMCPERMASGQRLRIETPGGGGYGRPDGDGYRES